MNPSLLAQLHNASGLRDFLARNYVRYALVPTASNRAPILLGASWFRTSLTLNWK